MPGTGAVLTPETNYIDGEWVEPDTDEVISRRNPSHPSEVVSEFPRSTPEEAQAAIEVAVAAQEEWARTSPHERIADAIGVRFTTIPMSPDRVLPRLIEEGIREL